MCHAHPQSLSHWRPEQPRTVGRSVPVTLHAMNNNNNDNEVNDSNNNNIMMIITIIELTKAFCNLRSGYLTRVARCRRWPGRWAVCL